MRYSIFTRTYIWALGLITLGAAPFIDPAGMESKGIHSPATGSGIFTVQSASAAPGAITGFEGIEGDKQILLFWDSAPGAASYTIYWDTAPGMTTALDKASRLGTRITKVMSLGG